MIRNMMIAFKQQAGIVPLAVACLLICGVAPVTGATLSGQVTSGSSPWGMPNVQVYLTDHSFRNTDANGQFSFDVTAPLGTVLRLEFYRTNFNFEERLVTVTGSDQTINQFMQGRKTRYVYSNPKPASCDYSSGQAFVHTMENSGIHAALTGMKGGDALFICDGTYATNPASYPGYAFEQPGISPPPPTQPGYQVPYDQRAILIESYTMDPEKTILLGDGSRGVFRSFGNHFRISNLTFRGGGGGGTSGLHIAWGETNINDCIFEDNVSTGSGASVLSVGALGTKVWSSIFRNNRAENIFTGMGSFRNSLFHHNEISGSAGAILKGNELDVVGSTFYGDRPVISGSQCKLISDDAIVLNLHNTIFWPSEPMVSWNDEEISYLTASHSFIRYRPDEPDNEIYDRDPQVIQGATAPFNFRLSPGSPAINAGSAQVVEPWEQDIDGNPRTFGLGPDLGAYERIITQQFTITVTSGGNGVILPVENGKSLVVDEGSDPTFTFITNTKLSLGVFGSTGRVGEGYELKKYQIGADLVPGVLVDGVPQPAVADATLPDRHRYTFQDIGANHTLHVEFVLKTYPVTVTVVGNGSVNPSGVVQVLHGTDKTFTLSSKPGTKLEEVIVDKGTTSETRITSLTSDIFILENVRRPRTVEVVFGQCPVPSISPNYFTFKRFSEAGEASPVISHLVPNGFGSIVQTQIETGPANSIVEGISMNCVGLTTKEAKPFVQGHSGGFNFVPMHCDYLLKKANEYFDGSSGKPNAEDYAYSEYRYDADPTLRLSQLGAPGLEYSLDPVGGNATKQWHFGVASADATNFLSAAELDPGLLDVRPVADIANYFLAVTKDPNGKYSQSISDKYGNVLMTWDSPDGAAGTNSIVSRNQYDVLDNLVSEVPPLGAAYQSTYQYNTRGQALEEQNPDNGVTEYRYDKNGRMRFSRNALHLERDVDDPAVNHYQVYSYDGLNRLIAVSENNNSHDFDESDSPIGGDTVLKVEYVYDAIDAQRLKNLNISASDLEIDRVVSEASFKPGHLAATIAYDESGTKNVVDVFSYDNREFLMGRYHFATAAVPVQKFAIEYDPQGKEIQKEYYNGLTGTQWNFEELTEYVYDSQDRLVKIRQDGSDLVGYRYNERGLLEKEDYYLTASATTPGEGMSYEFNVRDWLTSSSSEGPNPKFAQTMSYAGRYDGAIAGMSSAYRLSDQENRSIYQIMSYDGINRLTSVDSDDPIFNATYTYDKMSRLTSLSEEGRTYHDYTYESGNNRLSSLPGTSKGHIQNYVYDPLGNVVLDRSKNLVLEYDWRNQPYRMRFYDAIPAGNLTWRDVENNKLNTVHGRSVMSTLEFQYDAAGQRVLKDVQTNTGRTVSAYVDGYAVFEGASPSALSLSSLNFLTLTGLKGHRKLADDRRLFYLTDQKGSIRSVIKDDGAVAQAYMYHPYGTTRPLKVSTDPDSREKYSAKEFDVENGLYYYGFRYYDAEVGRWYSVDPMPQFHNSYSFVGGDPINHIDILGLQADEGGGDWDHPTLWDKIIGRDIGGRPSENGESDEGSEPPQSKSGTDMTYVRLPELRAPSGIVQLSKYEQYGFGNPNKYNIHSLPPAGQDYESVWKHPLYRLSLEQGVPIGRAVIMSVDIATNLVPIGVGVKVVEKSVRAARGADDAFRYLALGVGAAARGQVFKHAWIQKSLYSNLQKLVGKSDFLKFKAALKKGIVGPTGESGIKILRETVRGYTHELKIGGSAQRLLGKIGDDGILIFDDFVRGGLH